MSSNTQARSDLINWNLYDGNRITYGSTKIRTRQQIEAEISRLKSLQREKFVNYRNTKINNLWLRLSNLKTKKTK